MASIRDRDAGQDFEGNGPSSFDRRDYRSEPFVSDWGSRDGDAEKQKAIDAAIAQIERAFSPEARALYAARQAAKLARAA